MKKAPPVSGLRVRSGLPGVSTVIAVDAEAVTVVVGALAEVARGAAVPEVEDGIAVEGTGAGRAQAAGMAGGPANLVATAVKAVVALVDPPGIMRSHLSETKFNFRMSSGVHENRCAHPVSRDVCRAAG